MLDTEPSEADETAATTARSDAPRLDRRGRPRKFDRPPPPKDWRWWVSGLGRTLVAVGLLMFGFVAYQLWGTGIENARAQASLENEFEELLAGAPPAAAPDEAPGSDDGPADADDGSTSSGGTSSSEDPSPEPADDATAPSEGSGGSEVGDDGDDVGDGDVGVGDRGDGGGTGEAVPVDQQYIPEILEGDPIARLEIPRIGADDIVVAGVSKGDLKNGPGHFPETPLPGQLGNSAIAGHRTTYGQPFFDVDDLEPGDEIIATTLSGRYVYRVTETRIVSPNDYWVIATTDPTRATLTLTSCHPKWTARDRIIVFAELDDAASTAVGAPVLDYGRADGAAADDATSASTGSATQGTAVTDETVPAGDDAIGVDTDGSVPDAGTATGTPSDGSPPPTDTSALGSAAVNAEIADAFAEGWFSDPGANGQVLLWGLLLAAVGIVSYLVSRTVKRDWVGAVVGIVPFLVALYFFFQNVNRLLPPNL